MQASGHLQVIGQPLLACGQWGGLRHQACANVLAGNDTSQHIGLMARGDGGVRTAAGGALGGDHLGDHAATGDL